MAEPNKAMQDPIKTTDPEIKQTNPSGGWKTGQTGQGGTATRQAKDELHDLNRETGIDFDRASEKASEFMDDAKYKATDTYRRVAKDLNQTYDQALNYSRENPGKSSLIAFGVGIGVGLLLANGMMPRSRTSRLVPPVMSALSEIAAELFH